MDLLLEAIVGFVAGVVGGLLGLGGSIIIIPVMILYLSYTGRYTGSTQHLLQSAAMICNVFVAAPSSLAHWRAGAIIGPVLRVLVPTGVIGILAGVAASNSPLFARQNGLYLAILLAGFFLMVAVYNVARAMSRHDLTAEFDPRQHFPAWKIVACGLPMGFLAGLLGIGGGTICVPAQQLLLRMPLRHAIANSAVTILFMIAVGAVYKNITLAEHGESVLGSLRLAAAIIPTAIVGGYLGGRLTHILPRQVLRIIFIFFMLLLAFLTFDKAYRALRTLPPAAASDKTPTRSASEGQQPDRPRLRFGLVWNTLREKTWYENCPTLPPSSLS
ncbi:MAG TPA: sulfite exporter TauE/SafE family protein [Thermoguttaceae bacterium]|nr:sulfite exporter TauE/SafE family protein [Thermoguttaceae bacterium]